MHLSTLWIVIVWINVTLITFSHYYANLKAIWSLSRLDRSRMTGRGTAWTSLVLLLTTRGISTVSTFLMGWSWTGSRRRYSNSGWCSVLSSYDTFSWPYIYVWCFIEGPSGLPATSWMILETTTWWCCVYWRGATSSPPTWWKGSKLWVATPTEPSPWGSTSSASRATWWD